MCQECALIPACRTATTILCHGALWHGESMLHTCAGCGPCVACPALAVPTRSLYCCRSRKTYRNGTVLRDLDAPGARGAYNTFCGYFALWPDSHRLKVGAAAMAHRLKVGGHTLSNNRMQACGASQPCSSSIIHAFDSLSSPKTSQSNVTLHRQRLGCAVDAHTLWHDC
eukprot:GHUV01030474.1.p1 GENE.GHUV01030474.1~~GHUV01030474.1.p1  ORF type:complete len:169 (+),score=19.11 GHUV01030474.1:1056-1562(+)